MNDREKVIKELEIIRDYDPIIRVAHDDVFKRYAMDALDLLKAQEPVKPVVDIDTWKCGNCGHTLEHQELLGDNVMFHEQYNFCPECGRAVKWE